MTKIFQTMEFDAAHRLLGYNGTCNLVHGHTWRCDVVFESSRDTDEVGILVDYRLLKQYIKDNYDHRLLLNESDPLVPIMLEQNMIVTKFSGNPTAENICKKVLRDLCQVVCLRVSDKLTVRIYESKDNYAEESY